MSHPYKSKAMGGRATAIKRYSEEPDWSENSGQQLREIEEEVNNRNANSNKTSTEFYESTNPTEWGTKFKGGTRNLRRGLTRKEKI